MPKRKSEGQRTMVLLWWDCFSHDLWRFSHGRNMTNAQRLWNTSVPTYNFRTKTPVFSPTVGQKTGTCQKCWPNLPLSAPEWSICNGTWKVPPVLVGWGTVQNMLVKLDHETWRTIGVRKVSYLWKHHLVMAEPLGLGLLDPPPKIRSFGSNPPFLVGKKTGEKIANCLVVPLLPWALHSTSPKLLRIEWVQQCPERPKWLQSHQKSPSFYLTLRGWQTQQV